MELNHDVPLSASRVCKQRRCINSVEANTSSATNDSSSRTPGSMDMSGTSTLPTTSGSLGVNATSSPTTSFDSMLVRPAESLSARRLVCHNLLIDESLETTTSQSVEVQVNFSKMNYVYGLSWASSASLNQSKVKLTWNQSLLSSYQPRKNSLRNNPITGYSLPSRAEFHLLIFYIVAYNWHHKYQYQKNMIVRYSLLWNLLLFKQHLMGYTKILAILSSRW